MRFIDDLNALTHPGSLLCEEGYIHAPYDLEVTGIGSKRYQPLAMATVQNANSRPFSVDYHHGGQLHVINGMGVALGDSVIGLTALLAIRRRYPALSIAVYRPRQAPAYVQQLYQLARPLLGAVRDLPLHAGELPAHAHCVDLGNHLFWPGFERMPMIDFFLWALGVEPHSVAAADKANRWLQQLALPDVRQPGIADDYVLFCPRASTPVRSIPPAFHAQLVEALWQRFRLPVLGFGHVAHPRYRDISHASPDTAAFIAWISRARFLLTADTAAVHIAAGFDIPSQAYFTTMPAAMRVRDYPYCQAIELPLPALRGTHSSGLPHDLAQVEQAFASHLAANRPQPAACLS